MVKVAHNTSGIRARSIKPEFEYYFGKSGEPLEIPENHAKKILRNKDFYISDKPVKKDKKASQSKPQNEKQWFKELEEIKGIGKKTALDIIAVYPFKESLLEALSSKAHIPFSDNVAELLKKEFIH